MIKFFGLTNFLLRYQAVVILCCVHLAFDSYAQQSILPCFHGMIPIDSVRADLAALTAPQMEGRGTGQPGYQRAADFVAARLRAFNLAAVNRNQDEAHSFFHPVPYTRVVPTGGELVLGNRIWKLGADFVPVSRRRQDTITLAPIYRIQCPKESSKNNPLTSIKPASLGFSLLLEDRPSLNSIADPDACYQDLRKKAIATGVKQMFYSPSRFNELKERWAEEERHRPRIRLVELPPASGPSEPRVGTTAASGLQEYAVSRALFRSIKKHAATVDQVAKPNMGSVIIQNERDSFFAPNVVGMIRGKSRPDEYIILSAHLDHLGLVDGQVHPGADDNGSGSTVLLSVARALALLGSQNIQPDRSIVLVWFSGEENGLLGSRWMARTLADSLGIRSDQVFANINMDMLGRNDGAHGPDEPYLYVVHHHKNQSIRPFTERVNTLCHDLKLDYSYSRADDPERLFMRSDHYAFHQLGIPAFFLFSGLHEDYHKPSDTADKISITRLARNAGFVLNLAWQLAQRSERLDPVEP